MRALGPANVVTLGRAMLVGGVTALVVTSFTAPERRRRLADARARVTERRAVHRPGPRRLPQPASVNA